MATRRTLSRNKLAICIGLWIPLLVLGKTGKEQRFRYSDLAGTASVGHDPVRFDLNIHI